MGFKGSGKNKGLQAGVSNMTEDQNELRIERRAICEADKVPEEAIQAIFKSHPQIYGIEADRSVQGDLI
jgi:hypothetical protein